MPNRRFTIFLPDRRSDATPNATCLTRVPLTNLLPWNGTFQIRFDTKTSRARFAPMRISELKDSFATVVGHLRDTGRRGQR